MALLTDDCDIRDTKFWMEWGGNGDPYICLLETKNKRRGAMVPDMTVRLDFRFAMSGGNTKKHERVRAAIIELYRAMDEAGLNKHPKDDI